MLSRKPLRSALLVTLLTTVPLTLCLAQSDHQPLQVSPALGFQEILDNALRHAPEAQETSVRQQQADDFAATGRSWMAGRPSLVLNYYDDRVLDDSGQLEVEYGLQVPLWRPGEKRDSAELGERYQTQVTLWQDYLTLSLAGRVRETLAGIQEALVLLDLERQATATAVELVTVTTALFEAGAVARLDVMQTDSLLLEQRKRELQAEAALVDAERAYAVLTGLQARPAIAHSEQQAAGADIGSAHPLLRYLQSDIDLADSNITQNEIAAKGNPQLTLGSRRERGDRFTPYTDSINLSLSVPIGGKAFVSSRTSAARRQKVDAEVLYLNMQRTLEQALHEVEHQLFLTAEALPLAEQQAALGEERRAMAQTAFGQGEVTLLQVLPAIQEARTATRELELLKLQQQRLVTEFNQTIGVLP